MLNFPLADKLSHKLYRQANNTRKEDLHNRMTIHHIDIYHRDYRMYADNNIPHREKQKPWHNNNHSILLSSHRLYIKKYRPLLFQVDRMKSLKGNKEYYQVRNYVYDSFHFRLILEKIWNFAFFYRKLQYNIFRTSFTLKGLSLSPVARK